MVHKEDFFVEYILAQYNNANANATGNATGNANANDKCMVPIFLLCLSGRGSMVGTYG